MKLLFPLLSALALSATGFCADAPKLLQKVNVLPLALDDSYQFRKTLPFLYDPLLRKTDADPMVNFIARQRMDYGSVTAEDQPIVMGTTLRSGGGPNEKRISRCGWNTASKMSAQSFRPRNFTTIMLKAR